MLPSAQFLFLRFAIGMSSLCQTRRHMRIIHFHPTIPWPLLCVDSYDMSQSQSTVRDPRDLLQNTVTRSSARVGDAATTESGEIPGQGPVCHVHPAPVVTTWHWRRSTSCQWSAPALIVHVLTMHVILTQSWSHIVYIPAFGCNSTNCHDSRVHSRLPF